MTPEQKLFNAIVEVSGLNLTQIADKSEIKRTDLHRYREGSVNPPLHKLHTIAEKLNISITFKLELNSVGTVKI